MSRRLRIAYLAHSFRSDWNNGNAHFLRGLMRAMAAMGHDLTLLEPESEWSIDNLRTERHGPRSLHDFEHTYKDLRVKTYRSGWTDRQWEMTLSDQDIVILHEWNPPVLAQRLLSWKAKLGFVLLFHDTHHRASSTPKQIERFGVHHFDGVIAFGEALRSIYRERFQMECVWTLHEAADTTVFFPQLSDEKRTDVVWVGNWGDGERSAELQTYLLDPATTLASTTHFTIYGVRYPQEGLAALHTAHVAYGGYLPNLDAPSVYGSSRLTVHVPRQEYASTMAGIPTIRVFEALAAGIPLISAPWRDTEDLFRPGDMKFASSSAEMVDAMRLLLDNPEQAKRQAEQGLSTILSRHTCLHRAQELTTICEDLLS